MKSGSNSVHSRGLALTNIGRDPRSSDRWIAMRNFGFLSGRPKQRTISLIYRRPNFTKFEHNMSTDKAMKTFGTEF